MDTKTNYKNPTDLRDSKVLPDGFRYQKTPDGPGIEGFFEGYRLTFSQNFNAKKGKWQNIFSVFKTPKEKKPGIINSVDIYSLYSPSAKRAWEEAGVSAKNRKHEVGVEDIFLACLGEPSVKNLFKRMKATTDDAEIFLKNYLKLNQSSGTLEVQKIPFEAFRLAIKIHNRKIGNLMLLGALLGATSQDNVLQAIFSNIRLTPEKLEILCVWILDLPYDFAKGGEKEKILFCCRQADALEKHFGYFFEFPAIEAAINLSSGQTLKDLEHKKALQLLVKAGALAKTKGIKVISEYLVKEASKK
jgi:hypothetical protein